MLNTLFKNIFIDKSLSGDSSTWANWQSKLLPTTCLTCAKNHGKIVKISIAFNNYQVNKHVNCKCIYVPMRTKKVGNVTSLGNEGADVYLMFLGKLPDYYISKNEAKKYGWRGYKGNLDEVAPRKMIGGDVFFNDDGKLPDDIGRTWYEADLNYDGGYRNGCRIIYSNDGLFFVTYDHYQTFYEIIF